MNTFRTNKLVSIYNSINLNLQKCFFSTNINEFKIPQYIPRGDCDILKALSSTIKPSPHLFSYYYFNDDRLKPKNEREVLNFSIARENGIKAAHYFMKNYPELFLRDNSEPKVDKFTYPDVYDDNMTFDLNDLALSIDKRNVSNSIIAYEKLIKENIEVPEDVKLNLFQLACFFNSDDAFNSTQNLPFHRKMLFRLSLNTPLWKNDGFAEAMWNDNYSKENNELANSTYIQGLIKYGNYDKAYNVYLNFKKEEKKFNLTALESIIRSIPYIKVLNNNTLETVKNFLNEIDLNSFKPSISTINCLLFALSHDNSSYQKTTELAQQILHDLKHFNLKPTLGTYSHTLSCFYKPKNSMHQIIYQIIDKIQKEPIKVDHVDDLIFFEQAMKISALYLHDVELSEKIYSIFEKHNDFYLNQVKETNIYDLFFRVLAENGTTEQLFDYYDRICPGIYFPSIALFELLIDNIIVFESFNYLERFFKEWHNYENSRSLSLNKRIFHLLDCVPRSEKIDGLFFDVFCKVFENNLYSKKLTLKDGGKPSRIVDETINMVIESLIKINQSKYLINHLVDNYDDFPVICKTEEKRLMSLILENSIKEGLEIETIKLIKICISEEVGTLDESLLNSVDKSKFDDKTKKLIKSLILMC